MTPKAIIVVPDFELPVLPPEWRRVPQATLEELLQFARWNDPAAASIGESWTERPATAATWSL